MAELIPLSLIVLYILPFCIAAGRAHDSAVAILLVNLLLGWTGFGWLIAFAWAVFGPAQTPQSRARNARLYQRGKVPSKAPRPRILYNFTD